eukprot:TRINITY_DN4028_c0_g1_i6.p1 TRINITY_DN4028_c0_g1~~TRINITY_DN4028_c0_g1_i6.p1  ORF type:complete len:434 (+),score=51.65 TRINITY_DN4028_c0_g1_i6:124-1425(+)
MLWKRIYRCFSNLRREEEILLNFTENLSKLRADATRMNLRPEKLVELKKNEFLDMGVLNYFGLNQDCIQIYRHADSLTSVPEDRSVNYPRNGVIRLEMLFSKSENLRENFRRFYSERVRIGKMLEIFDYLAGMTAYKYVYNEAGSRICTFVTACVDRFQPYGKFSTTDDLILTAYPSYVGNSSVEVRVEVASRVNNQDVGIATTHFLMVARSLEDHSKPFKVPRLSFEGEDDPARCELRNELGKRAQVRRKLKDSSSVYKIPPTGEESIALFHLFRKIKSKSFDLSESVLMGATRIEKTVLMHSQDKNIHGKVFGGYLMREAYELAWVCAYTYSKGNIPSFNRVDDVVFHAPAEVGSVCKFVATVTFVQSPHVNVLVELIRWMPDGDEVKTTELHCNFLLPQARNVLPETYDDSLKYLEGKRRLQDLINPELQ